MGQIIFAVLAVAAGSVHAQLDWDWEAEDARQAMVEALFPDAPVHPPFPDEIGPESDNAAGRYLWAFERLAHETIKPVYGLNLNTPTTWEILPEQAERGYTLADIDTLLDDNAELIDVLIGASKMDRCEFHFDPFLSWQPGVGEGFMTDWGGYARGAYRLLKADAMRCWHRDQREDALERVAACIRFGHQIAKSKQGLIGSMVGGAIMSESLKAARAFAEDADPPFNEDERKIMLSALDELDADDPAGYFDQWNHDRAVHAEFIRAELEDGELSLEFIYMLAQSARTDHNLIDWAIEMQDEGHDLVAIRAWLLDVYAEAWDKPGLVTPLQLGQALDMVEAEGDRIAKEWNTPPGTRRSSF